MEALWCEADVIFCITLSTRPERRALADASFDAVGLRDRVEYLVRDPDLEDGKRGCFESHQAAAREALQRGARRVLIFEDDVEFLPSFTPFAASRARRFLRRDDWELFFLGHFAQAMEPTDQTDVMKVQSMDAHAYFLTADGMAALAALQYTGDQVDVHFHYRSRRAFALYPMAVVQRMGYSDTELQARPDGWCDVKLERERRLYEGCVRRAMFTRAAVLAAVGGGLEGPKGAGATEGHERRLPLASEGGRG
eukprot:scaffold9123_cov121-Isochrysis_galbana.AAC.3